MITASLIAMMLLALANGVAIILHCEALRRSALRNLGGGHGRF